jgi:AAA family ATP:ADP antiporter
MAHPNDKNLLERFLSLFTRVNPGEGFAVLLLTTNVFLLLGCYYILKTVREPLILAEGSAELKAYAAAAQAALLFVVIPVYGWLASRMDRMRFISVSSLFFVFTLAGFFALVNARVNVGFAFYIWLGIFNVFVVAQFWSFANDLYSEEAGKRLFPIIGVGASVGAWVGSVFTERLFEQLQIEGMMPLAAAGLLVCLLLTWLVNRQFAANAPAKNTQERAKEPLGKEGGFELVLKSPYLRLIAILILLLNVVNTTGGYILDRTLLLNADQLLAAAGAGVDRRVFIGQFYGSFFGWVNLLGLLFQLLLVPHLFRWIGVRGALFILPCIALGGYSALIAFPLLAVIQVAKIFENATDYSVQNTTRHALFLLTSREAKYKAKAAIDTFFTRTGDLLQAGVVKLGTTLGLSIQGFAAMNVGFTVVWLVVVYLLYREHKRLSLEQEAAQAQAAA